MGSSIDEIVAKMRRAPAGIRFSELEKVCDHYFESRNSKKTSHKTYKTPWPGNPRVNIQNDHGKAKPYQVNQVLQAIDKLSTSNREEEE
ncbi:toxin HicA [Corynebacterium sanguinis]|uniref:toxin HicA n=1 Tax=Corynebacterium sanguinis TaxID=2594913 RepID=UPI00223A7A6C|nr:toxin HicA [Corynebacterium sanguinis]MCT1555594.1 toxin HicA [Corynebacterium sanguinis]MCT1664769.1 toxin HicA [Corynebacterium sanguinis]